MQKVVLLLILLTVTGCCSAGHKMTSQKTREGIEYQADPYTGKTTTNNNFEWFKWKCEKE